MVGKPTQRLRLAQALLTRRHIKAQALQRRLRSQVVFALSLFLQGNIVSLTTTHKTLVSQLRLKLRPLALQLRVKARHDGLLRRHASVHRHRGKLRGIQLPLQPRSHRPTLRHRSSPRRSGNIAHARQVILTTKRRSAYAALRRTFGGPWMVNYGYDRAMALQAVASGAADLVAFGRPFIGNPDLGQRLREDLPWAPSDRKTYYGGGAEGYTNYADIEAPERHGAEGGAGSPGGAAAPA